MIRVFRPIPVERLKLLVFDLDGTLIDSAQDLCNSVNAALSEFNLGPLPDPAIAGFVGNGAPMLMRRSLALAGNIAPGQVNEDTFRQSLRIFSAVLPRAQARLHLRLRRRSRRAQGSARAARRSRRPAANHGRAHQQAGPSGARHLRGAGPRRLFPPHLRRRQLPLKKPDPLGLRSLMEETGATPEETVMIGDSKVDVETARNAGAWSVGCAFGFGPQNILDTPPDVLVDTAAEWTQALSPGVNRTKLGL